MLLAVGQHSHGLGLACTDGNFHIMTMLMELEKQLATGRGVEMLYLLS